MSENIPNPKIILVTGGDLNKLDFGLLPASIGSLLKANGYKVTIIKIDQCIDPDALGGDPSKYGELYGLQDKEGSIVSVNFGYYERFLDQFFTGDHYITHGKIMNLILEKKKQNSRHSNVNDKIQSLNFPQEINDWFKRIFRTPIDNDSGALPEICIIDFGRSYEEKHHLCRGKCNFFEILAFSKAISNLKGRKCSFMHIHLAELHCYNISSVIKSLGFLEAHHWNPDMIICQSQRPEVFEKYRIQISNFASYTEFSYLSLFSNFFQSLTLSKILNPIIQSDEFRMFQQKITKISHLASENVFWVKKMSNSFELPLLLQNQNAYQFIAKMLNLRDAGSIFKEKMMTMKSSVDRAASHKNVITIAIVGRFFKNRLIGNKIFEESDATAIYALKIAADKAECKLEIIFVYGPDLDNYFVENNESDRNTALALLEKADGIHFPSGNNWKRFNGFKIACQYAREKKKPFLALAYGFLIAAFEFVQNVSGFEGEEGIRISDEEIAKTENPDYDGPRTFQFKNVAAPMWENGGPVKNGSKKVYFLTKNSEAYRLYGNQDHIYQRYTNRSEVHPALVPRLISAGLRFVGVTFDESEREQNPADFQRLIDVAQSPADDEESFIQKINNLSTIYGEDKKQFKTAVRFSMFELKDHPFYVGTNFHAKFGGKFPSDPSPLYVGFIEAAKAYKANRQHS